MKLDDKKIKDILLGGNYVTADDVKKAEKFAKENRVSISEYFLRNGLITKDILGQAIAEFFGAFYADLNSYIPSREQVLRIPEEIAKKHRIVFFKEEDGKVILTTDGEGERVSLIALKKIFKDKKIDLAYSLSEDIDKSFVHYRKALKTRFTKIIEEQKKVAPEIITEIFEDALAYRASDVHFEPQAEEVLIRFRVDGMLSEAGRIPKKYYPNILNRIKVQSRLRIDEHFSAQDGAIRYEKRGGQTVDMRVSIAPTLDGEKVVIRLLAEYVRSFALSDLGFSDRDLELFQTSSKKPFGMILVTGPTGSGKTTTLYALLKELNRPEMNVTTIEDPVEYRIAGINQIQVNLQTNLTFAKGLRSIVRQDPDTILVGEIRDTETAEIAVNAALTGHLLLSTFHANDSATAIPRLLDMEVEPFLLASTLELLVAQRLVRRICQTCRTSYTETMENIKKVLPQAADYFSGKTQTLYKGKACADCSGTGYSGRIAIFELIPITSEMQDLMLQNPSTRQIWELARSQGARFLFEDGIEKVKNGVTTLEELLRVAQPSKA